MREGNEQAFEQLREKARGKDFAVLRTPAGIMFAPLKEGEMLSSEEINQLPEDERTGMEQEIEALQSELQGILRQVPKLQRQQRERLRGAQPRDRRRRRGPRCSTSCAPTTRELPEVISFLEAVQQDLVEASQQISTGEGPEPGPEKPVRPRQLPGQRPGPSPGHRQRAGDLRGEPQLPQSGGEGGPPGGGRGP